MGHQAQGVLNPWTYTPGNQFRTFFLLQTLPSALKWTIVKKCGQIVNIITHPLLFDFSNIPFFCADIDRTKTRHVLE